MWVELWGTKVFFIYIFIIYMFKFNSWLILVKTVWATLMMISNIFLAVTHGMHNVLLTFTNLPQGIHVLNTKWKFGLWNFQINNREDLKINIKNIYLYLIIFRDCIVNNVCFIIFPLLPCLRSYQKGKQALYEIN